MYTEKLEEALAEALVGLPPGSIIVALDESENFVRWMPHTPFEVDGIWYDNPGMKQVIRPMIQPFKDGKLVQAQWHAACGWCDGRIENCLRR